MLRPPETDSPKRDASGGRIIIWPYRQIPKVRHQEKNLGQTPTTGFWAPTPLRSPNTLLSDKHTHEHLGEEVPHCCFLTVVPNEARESPVCWITCTLGIVVPSNSLLRLAFSNTHNQTTKTIGTDRTQSLSTPRNKRLPVELPQNPFFSICVAIGYVNTGKYGGDLSFGNTARHFRGSSLGAEDGRAPPSFQERGRGGKSQCTSWTRTPPSVFLQGDLGSGIMGALGWLGFMFFVT